MIWVRKITAAVFFAALAFVYAEKAFHTHADDGIEVNHPSVTHHTDYSSCTICEFKLVPASEVPVIPECSIPVTLITGNYTTTGETCLYSPVAIVAGRGPPAI